MGVDKPNYTQMPNLLLDDLMMHMGEAELKVTITLSRLTFGYHRNAVDISLSKLCEITHMSRQGVINGINAGMERGTIERTDGKRNGFVYSIAVNGEQVSTSQRSGLVNEVDQSLSSQPNGLALVNEVDQASQPNGLALVNEVDQLPPTLKKVLKKDLKKDIKESAATQPSLADEVDFMPEPNLPTIEKTLTPQQAMYGAICEALGWDYHVITEKNQVQVAQAVKILSKASYTVDDIRRFMTEIWFKERFWTERGSYPSLSQLREGIGKLRNVAKQVAPPSTKGIGSFNRLAASIGMES